MGAPFIITIFAVIFVCIALAVIVAAFMRTNNELGGEETEQAHDPIAPVDNPHNMTGPLPPFLPLPHQTQPLSEIYYYNEPVSAPQPSAPLALPDTSAPPNPHAQSTQSEAPPPHMPPTGPLPGYYPNQ